MYSTQQDSLPSPASQDVNTYGFVVEGDVDSNLNMEAYSPSLSAYETAPETPICSPLFFSTTSRFLELPQTPRLNGADALHFGHHLQVPSGSSQSTISLSPIFPSDATTMIDSPPVDIMLFQLNDEPIYETTSDGICPTSKPVHHSMNSANMSLLSTLGDEASSTYEYQQMVLSEAGFIKDDTGHLNPSDCSIIASNYLPTDYMTTS